MFLVFTVAWFSVAYTIKSNLVTLIKNSDSDNTKISYSSVKISGYPFYWYFSLTDLRVKLIDHVNYVEYTTPKATLKLAFSTKRTVMNFGEFIKLNQSHGDKVLEYIVSSNEDLKFLTKFNKSLYSVSKYDNLGTIIKSIKWDNKQLSISKAGKKIYNANNLIFFIDKKVFPEREDIFCSLSGDVNFEDALLPGAVGALSNFKNAYLDLAGSLTLTKGSKENSSKNLKHFVLEKFVCLFDQTSRIDITGGLEFFENKLPIGKFSLKLYNYNAVIDKLLPSNIAISKKMIKTVIDKAIVKPSEDAGVIGAARRDYNNLDRAEFDVEFSEQGITIGAVNLLELKLGEDKSVISVPVKSILEN